MPIIPWECAFGDAPPVTLPCASTVNISPLDDSVDTNKVIIAGSGTINSSGDGPLITKQVSFQPTSVVAPIILTHSAALSLIGGLSRTIGRKSIGSYSCDGAGNWTEESFTNTEVAAGAEQFEQLEGRVAELEARLQRAMIP